MKRVMSMIGAAVLCSAAVVMAQSTTTADKAQMKENNKMMKSGTVMVTGCVADKDTSGHYMLNNAMSSNGANDVGTTGTTASSTEAMSYELMGGNLKAHVGHKVEITGTVEQGKMKKNDSTMTGTTGSSSKPETTLMGNRLKVKSVKMISDSCQ